MAKNVISIAFAVTFLLSQGMVAAGPSIQVDRMSDERISIDHVSSSALRSSESPQRSYTVKQGDTLYSVARRHGFHYRQLAEINGIAPPYWISAGQVVQIPPHDESRKHPQLNPSDGGRDPQAVSMIDLDHARAATTTTGKATHLSNGKRSVDETSAMTASTSRSGLRSYTVKQGDTLYSIARRHGFHYQQLAEINGIAPPYWIAEGQVLQMRPGQRAEEPVSLRASGHRPESRSTSAPDSKKPLRNGPLPLVLDVALVMRGFHDAPAGATAEPSRQSSLGISDAPSIASVPDNSSKPKAEVSVEGDSRALMRARLGQKSSLSATTTIAGGLGDVLEDAGGRSNRGFWDLGVNTPELSWLPQVKGDFSIGGFDWETGDGFGDEKHRSLQVGIKGKASRLSYGADYKSVGEDFYAFKNNKVAKDAGRVNKNVWVKHSLGRFSVKPFYKTTHNNIHEDPDKPVLTEQFFGASLGYTLMDWPRVGTSVSYASGTRDSSREPVGYDDLNLGMTEIGSKLWVSAGTWDVTLSADWETPSTDTETIHGEPAVTSFSVGGSYYPSDVLSITSTVSHSDEDYEHPSTRSRTLSTSLSASYRPEGRNYRFTAYSSYDTAKNADWWMDTKYFYSEAGVQWRLNKSGPTNKLLSLTLAYDRYVDGFYSTSNTSDTSIHLTFRSFAPLDIFSVHKPSN